MGDEHGSILVLCCTILDSCSYTGRVWYNIPLTNHRVLLVSCLIRQQGLIIDDVLLEEVIIEIMVTSVKSAALTGC